MQVYLLMHTENFKNMHCHHLIYIVHIKYIYITLFFPNSNFGYYVERSYFIMVYNIHYLFITIFMATNCAPVLADFYSHQAE